MIRKALLAALLVVIPASARAQAAVPDFRDYQSLLNQYVVQIAEKGEPFDTRFDYEQLYVDEKIWTRKRSARLEQLHAQLVAAKPSAMKPADRLAWGLNTYNFLVIENITAVLIRPPRINRAFSFVRYSTVDEIGPIAGSFFQVNIANIEGKDYSLDSFQRRFVFGDTTSGQGPRARLPDPRVRFATNPGRIGGPPLMPFAFHADSLNRQLDRATRVSLALPRFVTVQAKPSMLLVSDLLACDLADFGGTQQGMLDFVRKYAPRTLSHDMKRADLATVGRYLQADPKLNQKAHPKIIMSAPADADSVSP